MILTRKDVNEMLASGYQIVNDPVWVERLEKVGVPLYLGWRHSAPVGELGATVLVAEWAEQLVRGWSLEDDLLSRVLRLALRAPPGDEEALVRAAEAAARLDGRDGVLALLQSYSVSQY